jgi:hypothetical protein
MHRGELVTGAAADMADDATLASVARLIARIPGGGAVTAVEFGADEVTVWEIRPDLAGTPRVRYWPMGWDSLYRAGVLAEHELMNLIQPGGRSPALLVRSGPHSPFAERAFSAAGNFYRDIKPHRCAAPLRQLLPEAVARVPISQWYELVVLRRAPSGRLVLTAELLFPPDARRHDAQTITLRCEASDGHGTVFAVVSREAGPEFRLVSMGSARVPAGRYRVTATLLRPGAVRFDGLPVTLAPDSRSWLDVLAAVPPRLAGTRPAHLVVAVESCGSGDQVYERAERAARFVQDVANAAAGPMRFSLVGYGAHSFRRRTAEEPVELLAWAEEPGAVLDRLQSLSTRGGADSGYSRAAAIECMLAGVSRELSGERALPRRLVLVTIGTRPAFPHRADPVSEILPCPHRRDWRRLLQRLRDDHPGVAFGAIHDSYPWEDENKPAEEVWRLLGGDALSRTDSIDSSRFAADLGLLDKAQYVPFPMVVPAES